MRMTRKHRRCRTEIRPPGWVWLAGLLLIGLALCSSGATLASYSARQPEARVTIAALGTSSLILGAGAIDLGELKAGERVCSGTSIQNTSPRSIPLTATLEGAMHLVAEVTPAVLGPGETGQVQVTGHVQGPEDMDAYIVVTALNGFFAVTIPIDGTVISPPPEKPPVTKPCGTAGTEGEAADEECTEETTAPVDETTPPVDETTPPVDETTPPVDETTPPVDETTPPVDETTPPVDETTPPVDETTPPVDETTPPVDETTPPVDETTPPVDETTPSSNEATPTPSDQE